MMKKNLCLALVLIGFVACTRNTPSEEQIQTGAKDAAFENYKSNFIEALWKVYPTWGAEVGYHKYDSVLSIPDAANGELQLKFITSNLDSLKKYSLNELSDNNKTDYYMIENQLKSTKIH